MTRAAQAILRDALSLDESDRAMLADLLIGSLQQEAEHEAVDPRLAEIERRISELNSGAVEPIEWDEVRARLHASVRDMSEGSHSSL